MFHIALKTRILPENPTVGGNPANEIKPTNKKRPKIGLLDPNPWSPFIEKEPFFLPIK